MYILIRSKHIVRTWTRVPGRAITLCGRTADGPMSTELGDDKSCESCARVHLRREEKA